MHKNTLTYILGIKAVIIKKAVQVNVVHIIVEFKWYVDPRKVLVKKKPTKKNESSAKALLNIAIAITPVLFFHKHLPY